MFRILFHIIYNKNFQYNIIQWNLNGFLKNKVKLKLIIHNYDSKIIYLQDTNLKNKFTSPLKNY